MPVAVTTIVKEAWPELFVATVVVLEPLLKVPVTSVTVTFTPACETGLLVELSSWTTALNEVPTATRAAGDVVKASWVAGTVSVNEVEGGVLAKPVAEAVTV